MTNLEYTAQALQITLGSILVVKLLSLRLHVVYRLFSLFLLADLTCSVLWLIQHFLPNRVLSVDYRLLWVAERLLVCSLMIFTVYALLDAVLQRLPGILRFSQRFVNLTFVLAAVVAVLSSCWEYRESGYVNHRAWQDSVLFGGILADRVVSSLVLLAIISILSFLLWFPVQIPRNLAVFIVGFAIYSAGSSLGLLVQSLVVHDTSRWISTSIEFLMSGCCAYWVFSISSAGESPSQLNVRRNQQEQDRLIRNLELLNESLLRGASR